MLRNLISEHSFYLIIIWSLIFTSINFFIDINFRKRLDQFELWGFIGSKETHSKLLKEVSKHRKKINIKYLKEETDFTKINSLNLKGICYESFNFTSDLQLQNLIDSKFINSSIINLQFWCEVLLNCLPPSLISREYIVRGNFNIDKSIYLRFKKLADIFVSIILLVLTFPIIVIASVLIYLEDGGDIVYKQKRVGINGKSFTIYKLRSMRMNAEEKGPRWAKRKDERITFFGKILRKTRIDELPQLLCVIKGDMSLIGPRPERKEFEIDFLEKIPNYKIRHLIKPGLSGWAQVNYPYGASIEDAENKLSYDLFYIRNFSFLLDLIIFIKTIRLVANRNGSQPKN